MILRTEFAVIIAVLCCVLGMAQPAVATTYEIDFRLQTQKYYKPLDFTINESAAPGDFVGEGSLTACTKNPAFSGLGAWNHQLSTSDLRAGVAPPIFWTVDPSYSAPPS